MRDLSKTLGLSFVLVAAFAVVLAFGALPSVNKTIIQRVHPATHWVGVKTITDAHVCSATAVAYHALLMVSHCELGADVIYIDGEPAKVLGTIRDGHDHTIFLTDATFETYADFGPECQQGDPVFLFGNPAGHRDMYRTGVMAGVEDGKLLFDINGFHGDSGAAVFNESGQICAVVSFLDYTAENDQYFALSGAFPFAFTPAQLKQARSFDGTTRASLRQMITKQALLLGVPPRIALAVAQKESGTQHWRNGRVVLGDRGKSIGVFQIQRATAPGVDLTDVQQNVSAGIKLLRSLHRQYHDWRVAVSAYNMGTVAVDRNLRDGTPIEQWKNYNTYVTKVVS